MSEFRLVIDSVWSKPDCFKVIMTEENDNSEPINEARPDIADEQDEVEMEDDEEALGK